MDFRSHASSSAGNLYELRDGDARLAIECGVRWRDMQRALNHRVTSLDGVLLSHHHQDHARAVVDVMRAGVDVYASAETFGHLGLGGHRAKVLRPLEQVEIGRWRVLPFDLRHDAEGTLGFLVAGPDGDKLLYACDTAYCPYRFRGLTHVAIEANWSKEILDRNVEDSRVDRAQKLRVIRHHMSLSRVLGLLRANDLSRLRVVYLLHLSDDNSDAPAFKAAVAATCGKPVYVAGRGGGLDAAEA